MSDSDDQHQRFRHKRHTQYTSYEKMEPLTSLPIVGNNRSLQFHIPAVPDTGLDLGRLKLSLRLRLVKEGPGGVGKIDKEYKYLVGGLLPASIFSTVSFKLGEKEIFYMPNYPQYARSLSLSISPPILMISLTGGWWRHKSRVTSGRCWKRGVRWPTLIGLT